MGGNRSSDPGEETLPIHHLLTVAWGQGSRWGRSNTTLRQTTAFDIQSPSSGKLSFPYCPILAIRQTEGCEVFFLEIFLNLSITLILPALKMRAEVYKTFSFSF